MRKILRYYYDENCNKIEPYNANIDPKDIDEDSQEFHNTIAKKVIEENPELLKQYEEVTQNGIVSTPIFLVMKGYIYVGGVENGNMSAMFSSISLNDRTKKLMLELKENGYFIYDIIRDELTNEQKNEIRQWAKDGMTIQKIQNKVMKEMIAPLSPKKLENNKKEDFER